MVLLNSINWIIKDKNNRKLFLKYEIKKKVLKSLLFNDDCNILHKIRFDSAFKKYPFNSSISRYRTSCVILGNSRSVFQRFKLSRHAVKVLSSNGFLTGLKRSTF